MLKNLDNGKDVVGDVLCHQVQFWIRRRYLNHSNAVTLFLWCWMLNSSQMLWVASAGNNLSCVAISAGGWVGIAAPCLGCRAWPGWRLSGKWCNSWVPSGRVLRQWDKPLSCYQSQTSADSCICLSQDFEKVTSIEQHGERKHQAGFYRMEKTW